MTYSLSSKDDGATVFTQPGSQPIVVQVESAPRRPWRLRLVLLLLLISLIFNYVLYSSYSQYFTRLTEPFEKFYSGDPLAETRIARLEVRGTIMPPFTERWLRAVERAREDDKVKAVLLVVDSPGGFVADSHQLYHQLKLLSAAKPMAVAMKRMAASGGYYIAMGGGEGCQIFAEPTTWTGSIGVIIPRFDASELTQKLGVHADPLTSGEFKDTLSPFRSLTEPERVLWKDIINDEFQRFVNVIADNRKNLDPEQVKKLATGQIYTANQALAKGLVDKIGFEDEALSTLTENLGGEKYQVVDYEFRQTFIDILLGSVQASQPERQLQSLLEATVPRAMYFCSWAPALAGLAQ